MPQLNYYNTIQLWSRDGRGKMSELQQRKLFLRQPGNQLLMRCSVYDCATARAVLVDFRPPMDGGTCLNMLQALTDTLMLVHHLTGPSRVPLFTLIALGLYPEVIWTFMKYCSRDALLQALYPLQPVSGNQVRLLGALRELKNMCMVSSLPSSSTSNTICADVIMLLIVRLFSWRHWWSSDAVEETTGRVWIMWAWLIGYNRWWTIIVMMPVTS